MSRTILDVFSTYQTARTTFVQSIAEFSQRSTNIEILQQCNVLELLRPLLLDTVPSIQQTAMLALGRIASYNESLADQCCAYNIIQQIAATLPQQNKFYKKIACYVIKNVCKHSPELATSCVSAGVLHGLLVCLSDFEPTVRENAASAISSIANHNLELAQYCVDIGVIQPLILAIQEPELSLKKHALQALSDIANKSSEFSQLLVDNNILPLLAPLIQHPDVRIKKILFLLLSSLCKHTVTLAESVVEYIELHRVFLCLADRDIHVRKNAVIFIRELSKHSSEICQLIVNTGGHASLIQYIQDIVVTQGQMSGGGSTTSLNHTTTSLFNKASTFSSTLDSKNSEKNGDNLIHINHTLPAIMALGYISAYSELLATAVIVKNGVNTLKQVYLDDQTRGGTNNDVNLEDHMKCALVWTLGQLGKHTSEHSEVLARNDILRMFVEIYHHPQASVDLKQKTYKSYKAVISKCLYTPALESLLINIDVSSSSSSHPTSGMDLKLILPLITQFAKILPNNTNARKSLVQSKGIQKIQELLYTYGTSPYGRSTEKKHRSTADPDLLAEGIDDTQQRITELCTVINQCYPVEIIQFYSPNYESQLLQQIDQQIAV